MRVNISWVNSSWICHWILFMFVFFQWLMHTTKLVRKHSRWQFCTQSWSMPVQRHTRSLGIPQGIRDEVWQSCSRHSSWVISAHIWKGLVLSSKKAVLLPFSMMGQDTKIGSDSLLQRQICHSKILINGWFRAMFLKCHSEFMFKVEIYGNIFYLESSGNCVLAFTSTVSEWWELPDLQFKL